MALGIFVAVYSVGGVVSPFVVNPLTSLLSGMGMNVFTVSGFLALILGVIVLLGRYQQNLVRHAEGK